MNDRLIHGFTVPAKNPVWPTVPPDPGEPAPPPTDPTPVDPDLPANCLELYGKNSGFWTGIAASARGVITAVGHSYYQLDGGRGIWSTVVPPSSLMIGEPLAWDGGYWDGSSLIYMDDYQRLPQDTGVMGDVVCGDIGYMDQFIAVSSKYVLTSPMGGALGWGWQRHPGVGSFAVNGKAATTSQGLFGNTLISPNGSFVKVDDEDSTDQWHRVRVAYTAGGDTVYRAKQSEGTGGSWGCNIESTSNGGESWTVIDSFTGGYYDTQPIWITYNDLIGEPVTFFKALPVGDNLGFNFRIAGSTTSGQFNFSRMPYITGIKADTAYNDANDNRIDGSGFCFGRGRGHAQGIYTLALRAYNNLEGVGYNRYLFVSLDNCATWTPICTIGRSFGWGCMFHQSGAFYLPLSHPGGISVPANGGTKRGNVYTINYTE